MNLRWGLLGTGRINRAIIPAIRESGRGEVAGVASRDPARGEAYSKEWGIPRFFGSYEELLADPDIDVVYNSLHAPMTIRALEHGKHVLCEKPFAISPAEVDAVFAASAHTGRIAADGFMYRHHPRILAARRLLDEGAIGEAWLFRGTFTVPLDRPDNARWDPGLGGGSLWDIGCYPVSLARFLFSEPPARVKGQAKWTASGVDESFAGTMEFSRGRVAQFDCSFVSPYLTRAEVCGTRGRIEIRLPFRPDEAGSDLVLVREEKEESIEVPPAPWRYLAEVLELHARILDGAEAVIPPEETRDVIETISRLYASARGAGE